MNVNKNKCIFGVIVVLTICLFSACTEYKTASEMTCSDVADDVVGMVLTNNFGGQFEILKVRNSQLISRSDTELVCNGRAMFSSGSDEIVRMAYWQDEDGDWWFNVGTVE